MTSSSNTFDKLRDFLKVMFQFGDNDLDFGIYRITRLKRQFIEAFIDGEGDHSLRSTVNGPQLREITRLIEAGAICPVIDRVFPFESTNEALTYIEAGHAKGKVVVKIK